MIMNTLTISRKLTGGNELVVMPRIEYERFLRFVTDKQKSPSVSDIGRWSREAKKLKQAGKLPVLRSLKDLQ